MPNIHTLVVGKIYRFVGDGSVPSRNSQFIGSIIYVTKTVVGEHEYKNVRLLYDLGDLGTDYFPLNTTDVYEELSEEESVVYRMGG